LNNEASNSKKKDSERKEIKDIGEFLRNKKNEMKYFLFLFSKAYYLLSDLAFYLPTNKFILRLI